MCVINQRFCKRLAFYVFAIVLLNLGIAISAKADIGIPPGGSIPFALSKIFPVFTMGVYTQFYHVFCLLVQLIVIKRVTVKLVLQIPLVYMCGLIIDVTLSVLTFTSYELAHSIVLLLIGLSLVAFAIAIIIRVDLMLTPTDAMLCVLGQTAGWPMSKAKFAGDTVMVLSVMIFTSAMAGNPFLAVSIGTVICWLLTGPAVGICQKLIACIDLSPR